MADVENLFGSDAESEGNLHSFQRVVIRFRYLFDHPKWLDNTNRYTNILFLYFRF